MENQNNLLFNKTTICIDRGMYLLNHTVVISKQGKRGESGIFSLPETTCKLLQPALRIVIIYNDKRLKKGVHPAHSDLILIISFGKYMTFLKVSLIQIEFMKSSFLPKCQPKIFYICVLPSQDKNLEIFRLAFWEKQ